MKVVLLVAAYCLIPIAAKVWLSYCLNSYIANDYSVRYRPYVLIIGIADVVVFLAVATAATIMEQLSWFVVLGCFLFVALGVFVIVAYCNCRIRFDDNSFTVTNFWGKEHIYTYNEITGICNDSDVENTLYCGTQRVEVARIAAGSKEFLAMVQKQYKRLHGGAGVPRIMPKKDLFNGHIRNPVEYIVGQIIVCVLLLGILIAMPFVLLRTYDESNTTLKECIFTSCVRQEQELLFTSDTEERYIMEFVPQEYPVARLKALCDGQTPLKVYVREVTPEDEQPYYGIEQIQVGDTVVLSFEESKAYGWDMNRRNALLFVAGVAVFGWLSMGFAIVVGRNPNQYPRWVVHLFFKKGYVIYDK